MSTRHHTPVAQEVNYLLNQLRRMDPETIEREYQIGINKDGTVYDPAFRRTFKSISDWVQASVEEDFADDTFIHIDHRSKYEDD